MHPKHTKTCHQCARDLPVSDFKVRTKPNGKRNGLARVCNHCLEANRPLPLADRFWSHVDRSGGPDACWPWLAGQDGAGYGAFRISPTKVDRAHRVAWVLTNGPVPDGLFVCHDCPDGDFPLCCNPAHFFLGTSADNNRDRHAKGRTVVGIGEGHNMAKLSEVDVRRIRSLHAQGRTVKSLAVEYGLSESGIDAVVRRRTWKHVA